MATTVFVVAEPDTPQLALLNELPHEIELFVGTSLADVAKVRERIDAVLVWSGTVGGARGIVPECVESLPNLKWIHTRWAGMDSFLFPALVESPIVVTNARGVYAESLAEFVIAAAFYFAKDIPRMNMNRTAKRWSPFDIRMLAGSTMGIYGAGAIGSAVARRAKALGMTVSALRRSPEKAISDPNIDRAFGAGQLLELSRGTDYFVVTAPLTPETKCAIGKAVFDALPESAVVINVGRGPVIDEPALIEALREKRVRGAALDVFTNEPLASDSPLYTLDNVLVSPHCADHTATWLDDTMRFFRENLLRFAAGNQLENIVDKRLGY